MKLFSILAVLILLSATSAFARKDLNDEVPDQFEARDPLKPINQPIFNFNLAADRHVIAPVVHTYHDVTPDWTRTGINNFLTNLGEPNNCVNGVLQRDPKLALTAFWRFVLNSTFGLGGVVDFAGHSGSLKSKDTDFGKTLGTFDIGQGAYVVLPIIGPSSVRDTAGQVVDWFLDPVGWFLNTPETIAQIAADGVNTRDNDDAIIEQYYYDSLEPYTATRAAYLQHTSFR